jgi:alanyl-tRNA synthetase
VDSNYDTDLFQPLIRETAVLAGLAYGDDDEADVSMRVVADHLRAVAFLLVDGVVPSNEGRGYVLRHILRRAVRHGMRLGFDEPFFHRLLPVLEETMSQYPELGAAREASAATIESEEGKFLVTVASGARRVQEAIESARREGRTELDGETVFRLYDTHGLPPEMVREIAEEEAFSLDQAGFEAAMDRQRERSRSAGSLVQAASGSLRQALRIKEELPASEFSGYDRLTLEGAEVLRLARQDGEKGFAEASSLAMGEEGVALLDRTVFYGEAGGQVGDRGEAVGNGAQIEIVDTQKDASGLILHHLKVSSGSVAVGDTLELRVDEQRRVRTQRNHTATHLLQAALRDHLGPAVRQAGSLVDPDRLRFDFTFDRPVDDGELVRIEEDIAAQIRKAQRIMIGERSHQDAVDAGAMALFGEKYGDRVRTVEVPDFSLELCGGCHVSNTGEIGGFRIVSERGVASGVRRIEAITGDAADQLARVEHEHLHRIEVQLGVPAAAAAEEIEALRSRLKEAEKGLARLRMERLSESDDSVREFEVAGIKVISREVASTPFPELRSMADVLKQRLGSGVVVLGTHDNDKVNLVVAVSDDVKHRVDAGELARKMGSLVGGNGGGRANFAQAGGKDPALLAGALTAVPGVVEDQLAAGNA